MSLARQADRVLEIEDELTSGLTQLNSRLYGWWRIAVSGKDEAEAISRAQQVLDVYRPKVQIEHPEAQYRYAREFIPGEPLASTAYRRRGSVTWAAAAVPAATASVGDRRGIMIGETCTATRRPVAWDPWLAQEVRRASGLTAIVGGLGSGKSFLTGLDRLQDAARRRALDGARPVRPAGRAHPAARAGPVLPAHQPAAGRSRHPQPVPGGGRAAPGALRRRGGRRAGLAPGALAGRRHPPPAGARRALRAAALRRRPAAAHPDRAAARRPRGRRRRRPAPRHGHRRAAPARPRGRGARRRRRRLPGRAPRAAAGRAAVPGHLPARPVAGRPRLPAHRADHAGHDAAPPGQPARGVDRRRVAGRRAAQPGLLADPAHDLRRRPQPAQGRRARRDALPVPGAHRQGAHRPARPRLPQVQRAGAVRLPAGRRPAAGVRVRLAGQRGVRRPHRRRRGPERGAAAAEGAHRRGLRADAGHALAAPAPRRPARRHPAPVRVRRRPRRCGEDPDRPGGARTWSTCGRRWTPTRTRTGCR